MMHQPIDPNVDPPRDEPPSLAVAALTLTERRTPHPVALAGLLWAVAVEAVRSALRR